MRTRRSRWVLWCGLLLACGGCTILENEFSWLDRLPPSVCGPAPDAAPAGPGARP